MDGGRDTSLGLVAGPRRAMALEGNCHVVLCDLAAVGPEDSIVAFRRATGA